ncbi:MAG: serine/threonine protein kinase, partial [Burkholderiales bacterium]|nr:serine/threonine protein kinase [Burkholderiales bacterium]
MSSAGTFTTDGHANALPPGTRLGEFEIRRVIGVGGFGIVYLAFDHGLEREVAIKEYMPSSLASRTATLHVSLTSPSNEETFKLGLRSFVNEAKLLARFDHRSLIKVHRFWEDRGTAYMVMPLLRGHTLREARRQMTAPPNEAWLRGVLDPVLGALEVLHREDVYHRDIAPDNILVGEDGVPMLLDFGAARHVIQGRSQTLTAILKPSYAPIEQYGEATNLRQGAWTDLYALGATFHYLLTESPPLPATVRTVSDDAAPLASVPRPGVSEAFLRTVDWMLAPRPADRPQSVAELREVLAGRSQVPVRTLVMPSPSAWQRTEAQITPPTDIEIEPDVTRLMTNPAPLDDAPAAPPSPRSGPATAPPPMPRPAAKPAATPAPNPPPPSAAGAHPATPPRAEAAAPVSEAWSATADRVLPPGASGPVQRALVPKLAVGAAVAVAGAALWWFVQRPAPVPGPPAQPAQAASAAQDMATAASAAASSALATAGAPASAAAPEPAPAAASAVAVAAPPA